MSFIQRFAAEIPHSSEDAASKFGMVLIFWLILQSILLEFGWRNAVWKAKAIIYRIHWLVACGVAGGFVILFGLAGWSNTSGKHHANGVVGINSMAVSTLENLEQFKLEFSHIDPTNTADISNMVARLIQLDLTASKSLQRNSSLIQSDGNFFQKGNLQQFLGEESAQQLEKFNALLTNGNWPSTNFDTSAVNDSIEKRVSILSTIKNAHQPSIGFTFFAVFLLGFIRALMEFVLGKAADRWRILSDSLFFGLILSLLLDGFPDFSHSMLNAALLSTRGAFVIFLCALVYWAWVGQLIYNRLTKVEGFAPKVAKQFFLHPTMIPEQALFIGSKKAGKSTIFDSATNQDTRSGPDGKLTSTTEPNSASCPWRPDNAPSQRIGIVDTPGEHLGTHLAAAQNLRTDLLAIVVNAITLKTDFLEKGPSAFGTLDSFILGAFDDQAKTTENGVLEDTGKIAKEYWLALNFATKQHANDKELTLKNVYKVKALAIFVFIPPECPQLSNNAVSSMNKAAYLLADRFKSDLVDVVDARGKVTKKVKEKKRVIQFSGLAKEIDDKTIWVVNGVDVIAGICELINS